MSESESFKDWIDRMKVGEDAAATEVFNRFAQRLISLSRSRLDERIRQKVDPEDVMLSTFKSFFHRQAAEEFDISSWDSLWSLLVIITLRKCGWQLDAFYAASRDISREVQLRASSRDNLSWELEGIDPKPSKVAMLTETVEHLMQNLDDRDQQILSMRLQSYTIEEISEAVGRTERTIHRILARVRTRLEQMDPNAPQQH